MVSVRVYFGDSGPKTEAHLQEFHKKKETNPLTGRQIRMRVAYVIV
jgi:hypothetical protein